MNSSIMINQYQSNIRIGKSAMNAARNSDPETIENQILRHFFKKFGGIPIKNDGGYILRHKATQNIIKIKMEAN